jgi:hypothetical protein
MIWQIARHMVNFDCDPGLGRLRREPHEVPALAKTRLAGLPPAPSRALRAQARRVI